VDKITVIIPARKGSTRFPAKVLHPILGKPLVLWVVEGALGAESVGRVIVATDDSEIVDVVESAGYEAAMTRSDHPSGTDRVWEVAGKLDAKWVLNLQGDEPLITGDIIDSLASVVTDDPSCQMVTMIRPLDPSEASDPNRVKVVTDINGNALYFSRSPIPYVKDRPDDQDSLNGSNFYLHVGLYLFRRDILEKFINLPRGTLEISEGLEQLRALENGIKIRCVETRHEFLGVDTFDDVPRVENALKILGESG